ncbi:hypothetical protein HZA56_12565 [Candidatus Poribacteria bacterium]|nr:hypothetical protein [Candidatus Poribacteria bacterium]
MQTVNQPTQPEQINTVVVKKTPTTTGAYSLNDLYHARKLVEFHGQHIRHCPKLGGFFIWNGRHWTPDEEGQLWRWTIQTAAHAYNADFSKAANNERVRLNKWITRAQSGASVQQTLKQLQNQPEIMVTPDHFDRDPWLFNVNNGAIDLRTGKLREHRPEDMITKLAPIDFNPACPQPGLWTNFLKEIFGGNQNLVNFIKRVCGYALTGSVAEQKLFLLHGAGANGKTTFLETLMFVMGDYSLPLSSELLFSSRRRTHPPEFADLKECRLAAVTEVEFNKSLSEPAVKKLTAANPLAVRPTRRDRLEFDSSHKLFICADHIPIIQTTDHAIWRRITMIPFNVTIPEERQDKDLPQKLRAEARGILNWLVAGCLEWQKTGLDSPAEVTDAINAYRGDMDPLGAFLADRCDIAPEARENSADLYSSYTDWCECNDERPLCPRLFGMRLRERGFKPERTMFHRIWQGLTRKEINL